MANVIIIGSGPAGVSSSLYTVRSGIDTTIISKGIGALYKADKIENYYGFSKPIKGEDLHNNAIDGAKRLGVKFINEEVVGLGFEDKYIVKTNINEYRADGVIIATGSTRKAPEIEGINEFEGKGISYCAVCDAFFYRGKNVAVIGNGEYALNEAKELSAVANNVVILTNGEKLITKIPDNFSVIDKKIKLISGSTRVNSVIFDDATELEIDGVFIAIGVAGSVDLAKKIGAITQKNKIVVDENMKTNLNGLYAAGDCTGGILQISKAVYEGAKAGIEIIKYLK